VKQQIQLRRREAVDGVDLPADLPPLLQRLYASRGVRSAQELERSVKGMLPWTQLTGVEKAVEMLHDAFRKGCILWWSAILTPTAPPAPR
jgi:single-stranded-DNA-specific exonuclease